ncbi:MAG: hypothetical protein IJJ48_04210 [Firmicutes bacterium]|nr:hypothetical protein [Bacillota bacterium]
MKNITTYYSSRKNVFVWLAVLVSVVSLVTRFFAFGGAGSDGFWVMVVHMLFPLAANLFISIRLPWRCGEMYYVTVGPAVLLAIYFFVRVCELGVSVAMTVTCLILCALQGIAFAFTYTGKLNSQIPCLLVWLLPLLFALDKYFIRYFRWYWRSAPSMILTDLGAWLSVVFIILASKRMAPWKEGDPYRRRYGDRMDGRRVYDIVPMSKLTAYFMPTRVGSSNYIRDSIEVANLDRYIHEKRRQGLKHFGLTHIFLAAYVRAVAEFPALNRFIAGQKIFHRFDITCSMVIKKEMSSDSPDTTIKVTFDPADTAADVYEKFNSVVQGVKETQALDTGFDKVTRVFDIIPSLLLSLVIWLLRILDYFGLLPVEIQKLSPFHASMFITSMGSLGIPPIYHHLYDFGTMPVFCAFGAKRTERTLNAQGEPVTKKYVDFTWVTDERICDGFYSAAVLKKMKSYLTHPEVLDVPPEEIKQDVD